MKMATRNKTTWQLIKEAMVFTSAGLLVLVLLSLAHLASLNQL